MEELEHHGNVSQRRLAERLGMAPSLVNRLIQDLVDRRCVEIVDSTVRPFAYYLTPAGRDYYRQLSDAHFRSVVGSYRDLQRRIRARLLEIQAQDVVQLVLYGAGDVMEMTYPIARELGLGIVGIVDDDSGKQDLPKGDLLIRSPVVINELQPDAILITTFRHTEEIRRRIAPSLRSKIRVFEL